MHFDSLEKILTQLEQQPGWEKFRLHRQLLKAWSACVSKNTAVHTRPLYVSRQVFWVATSSAARAQELSFQRYTLLKKLNRQLPVALKDIRFSASGWHQTSITTNTAPEAAIFTIREVDKTTSAFPISKALELLDSTSAPKQIEPADAKVAAQKWLQAVSQNSATLTACPICAAPTPQGEIKRWNSCYHCIAKKWSEKYRR